MVDQLTLPEKWFLLTQNPKLSDVELRTKRFQKIFVIGACFLELEHRKKIAFDTELKVQIKDKERTCIPYLDVLLMQIAKSQKEQKLSSWLRSGVLTFWKANEIYELLVKTLLEKEVMQVKKKLWFINYIPHDFVVKRVIEQVRSVVLESGFIRENELSLVLMLDATRVLKKILSMSERKRWKKRLEELSVIYPDGWKTVEHRRRVIHEVMLRMSPATEV